MGSPFRLDNRMALITGGSIGIGEATTRAFTRAGASVIILSIDKPRSGAIVAELPGSSVIVCDVTEETAVNAAIGGIKKLDILVHSADSRRSGRLPRLRRVRLHEWRRTADRWRVDCRVSLIRPFSRGSS
jgi:NAD(P)-dependent dehydrogenase (short-subunit alcohol dehydrogenase family)